MRLSRIQSRRFFTWIIVGGLGTAGLIACGGDDTAGGTGDDDSGASEAGHSDSGHTDSGDANAAHDTSVPDGPVATVDSGSDTSVAPDAADASMQDAADAADATSDIGAQDANDASAIDASTPDAHDGSADAADGNADAADANLCGNGTINSGEQCDLGASNTGAYGGCNADCTLAAYCGDGIGNGSEGCDLGKANSDTPFGTCTTTCTNTSLLLWVDGSDPNGDGTLPADNTQVGAWIDKARGRSVVQSVAGRQPTFVKSGVAGKPSFQFSGTGPFFDADLDINGSVLPELTVVAVFENAPGDPQNYAGVWGHDDGGWDRFIVSGGFSGGNGVSNGGGFTPVLGILTNSVPLVTTTTLRSNTPLASTVYVNGVFGATFDGSISSGTTHMSIGALNGPSAFAAGWTFDGTIAEVLVYGTAITDAERIALETTLIAKYTP